MIGWTKVLYNFITMLSELKQLNCQHNSYLESVKMSIIGKKSGKCQKLHRQILEHNRLKHSLQCIRDDVCKVALNVMDLFLEACVNKVCMIT